MTTVVLAAVNPLLAVFVVGNNPFPGSASYLAAQTTFDFGTGQLSRIQGNVTASKAVLHIDDSTAAQPSNLELTATNFNSWLIPNTNLTPSLSYSNLYKTLTVEAGAGDQFELDHTPANIDAIVLNNVTATQDAVYSTNWSVPITANANWSLYLGWFLHADGVVERIKSLAGLAIPVTLNFSGTPIGRVVMDGDADPAGAQYIINGQGNLHFTNQTVGLDVTINGYRDQDQAYIYLPGGTVGADLRKTGPGTLYVDGKSRLTGNHPTAPNNISAQVRAGDISLNPVDTNDSVLHAFNTFFVLGSMPQDSMNVTAPTTFKIAPRSQGQAQVSIGLLDDVGLFSPYNVLNPPPDYFVVLSTAPYQGTVGHPEPDILEGGLPRDGQIDYYDTYFTYQGPTHTAAIQVRVFPLNSHPTTTDNHVDLDASQLRGALNFQAAEPDYALAETLAGYGVGTSYWGAQWVTTFGQTIVNLTKVNPELAVNIAGTNSINSTDYSRLQVSNLVPIINLAGTEVNVVAGVMANIQGNVAVHNVWLNQVDDRQGTSREQPHSHRYDTFRVGNDWRDDAADTIVRQPARRSHPSRKPTRSVWRGRYSQHCFPNDDRKLCDRRRLPVCT